MSGRYEMAYDSDGLDYVEHLDGIVWADADPPKRGHRCWAQTRGLIRGSYVERCACGAFGPAPFFMLRQDKPRVAESRPRALFARLGRFGSRMR